MSNPAAVFPSFFFFLEMLGVDCLVWRQAWDNRFLSVNSNHSHIPKNLHMIWLGEKNIPEKWLNNIRNNMEVLGPDWEYYLWTDRPHNVAIDHLQNKKFILPPEITSLSIGVQVDYARYKILYEHGGVYADINFVFLNQPPEWWHSNYNFVAEEHRRGWFFDNYFFMSEPQHPVLQQTLHNLYHMLPMLSYADDNGTEMMLASMYPYNAALLKYMAQYAKAIWINTLPDILPTSAKHYDHIGHNILEMRQHHDIDICMEYEECYYELLPLYDKHAICNLFTIGYDGIDGGSWCK